VPAADNLGEIPMWKGFVAQLDEAKWRYGRPRKPGEPRGETWRCLGDFEQGPWIYVIERPAGLEVRPHSHDQDEVVFILDGGLHHAGRWCGPGTMLSFPRRVPYGFTVGPDGVQWLMVRTGASHDENLDDWQDHLGRSLEEYVRERRPALRRSV